MCRLTRYSVPKSWAVRHRNVTGHAAGSARCRQVCRAAQCDTQTVDGHISATPASAPDFLIVDAVEAEETVPVPFRSNRGRTKAAVEPGVTCDAHDLAGACARCPRFGPFFGPRANDGGDFHPSVTWTTRLRKDAALFDLAPPRTGKRGRRHTAATPAQVVERYAARWLVEVAIEDAKQLVGVGVGQARNRVKLAVERTVPFGLTCQILAAVWYATAGHHPTDTADHRARAPWYTTKTHPSTADTLGRLRRVLIAAKYQVTRPERLIPAEIHTIRLAWENAAA